MVRPFLAPTAVQTLLETLEASARWCQRLDGWVRLWVSMLAGALSALAFAPLYFWPIFFFTFPALVWLIDGAARRSPSWREAVLVGWFFGFGFFFVGLHWVGFAFVVDADAHGWQLPFVAVLFPGGLALFFGVAAASARIFWQNGVGRALVLTCAICVTEWLRGHIFTGLPWNLLGYAWAGSDVMIQTSSVYGIYGLSLVTLLMAALPATLVLADGRRSLMRWPLLLVPSLLVGLYLFGTYRVPATPVATFPSLAVRLVQPNVPQNEKWKPELFERNWRTLVDLTRSPGLGSRRVVIWPEAAPPFFMLSTDGAMEAIGVLMPDTAVLLTGTQRVQRGSPNKYFNSLVAIDGAGRLAALYDKSHLVPFGEYLPFFQLLEPLGIRQLTGANGGFSQGSGVRSIGVAGLPAFGPLICYEAIFPGAVVDAKNRPQWLVNVTDDSWFGPWAGPYQHLGIAKIRAVEEGLAVARAANTGVSAIIDPYGRIIASLGLDESGVVDSSLPKPLESTIFSFAGDAIFAGMMLALVGVVFIFSRTTS